MALILEPVQTHQISYAYAMTLEPEAATPVGGYTDRDSKRG